jgi:hypothetical protein
LAFALGFAGSVFAAFAAGSVVSAGRTGDARRGDGERRGEGAGSWTGAAVSFKNSGSIVI